MGPMWYDNPVNSSRTARAGRDKVRVDRDFFLSFTGTDRPWAEWLLAELDAAGYCSVSQLRDFLAGGNFALDAARLSS
jgi:hypothetical protein